MLDGRGKEGGGVGFEMLAIAERPAWIDKLCELRSALDQWAYPQILAIEIEKVESEEHKSLRIVLDGIWQRIEIRCASLVLNNDLAIDQRRAAEKP
jgi:hypothetical protein